jgi:NTE family protein
MKHKEDEMNIDSSRPVNTAVVLGGGGATGMAWETGVLAALIGQGLNIRTTDMVIGSSAGSFVGAALLSGIEMSDFIEVQKKSVNLTLSQAHLAEAYAGWHHAFTNGGSDPIEVGKHLGHFALSKPRHEVAEARKSAVRSWLVTESWPENLFVTAINALTGDLSIFGRQSNITLLEAVSASGAIPGLWPPVFARGQTWIDGGMVSTTNSLRASVALKILIVAPMPSPSGLVPGVSTEAELLSRRSEVVLIAADSETLKIIGPNIYDAKLRDSAYREGLRQGKAAASLLAGWFK